MAQVGKAFSPVASNAIWTEICDREQNAMKLTTTFQISDPRKLRLLPSKPNATSRADQPTPAELDEAHATLWSLSCIKNYERTPKEVWALPVTSNMEYGFFAAPTSRPSALFSHPLKSSDVSTYASAYIAFAGRSPYVKAPSAGAAATGK